MRIWLSLVDDMDEDDFDELENDTQSIQSSSRMTARQAAIASGVDSELVQLSEIRPTINERMDPLITTCRTLLIASRPSKKKKHLTEAEQLARKNETAVKRRHMTEKKLEDNKVCPPP